VSGLTRVLGRPDQHLQARFLQLFPTINLHVAYLLLQSMSLRQVLNAPLPTLVRTFPSVPRSDAPNNNKRLASCNRVRNSLALFYRTCRPMLEGLAELASLDCGVLLAAAPGMAHGTPAAYASYDGYGTTHAVAAMQMQMQHRGGGVHDDDEVQVVNPSSAPRHRPGKRLKTARVGYEVTGDPTGQTRLKFLDD
jgi:hypothetical protein